MRIQDDASDPKEGDRLARAHLPRVGAPGYLLDADVALAHDQLPDLEGEEQRRKQGEAVHGRELWRPGAAATTLFDRVALAPGAPRL